MTFHADFTIFSSVIVLWKLAKPVTGGENLRVSPSFIVLGKADWIAPIGSFCIYFCDLYADMNGECTVLGDSFKP